MLQFGVGGRQAPKMWTKPGQTSRVESQNVTAAGVPVERGEFGADMKVQLINDGPVTFWLSTRDV